MGQVLRGCRAALHVGCKMRTPELAAGAAQPLPGSVHKQGHKRG